MVTNHGHVKPNPDGSKTRCGGPGLCPQCSQELATFVKHAKPGPMDPDQPNLNIVTPDGSVMNCTRHNMGDCPYHPELRAALPPVHVARRDSDVAAWIKAHRDRFAPGDPGYFTLDRTLDDYRDHADTGTPLGEEVQGPEYGDGR